MSQVINPYEIFLDVDGDPLNSGYLYIGTVGLDAETNPIAVYYDEALTVPASLPVRTVNGYVSYNGSPRRIYVAQSDYSITVKNKNGSLVYSATSSAGIPAIAKSLALSGNAVFATFADLGTGTTKDGVLDNATIAAMHTAGTLVRTEVNNTTSNAGGAEYKILTTAEKDAAGFTVAGEGKSHIQYMSSDYWFCLNPSLEITPFKLGGVADGVTDSSAAILSALRHKNDFGLLEGFKNVDAITITDDVTLTLDTNLENANLAVTGQKTLTTTANNITRFDDVLTLAAANFSVGDLVLIEGTIDHENYTPNRYTTLGFVAEVRAVSGLTVTLDTKIDFKATTVTVSKIPKIDVHINSDLIASRLSFTNVRSVRYKGKCSGDIGTSSGESFLSVTSAKYVDIDIEFNQAFCVFGLVNNNISGGNVKLKSFYSGGLSTGSTSKMYRANAIQNMTINAKFTSSKHVDSTIYAARNLTYNCQSIGGGANFFDTASTATNRLESIQFSECDRVTFNGQVTEANDQAVEMLSCTDSTINGYIANSKVTQSSEGAVVIKGVSDNVIVNAEVQGYNSRGLKIECVDGSTNCGTSATAIIYSSTTEACAIRDASSPYDCAHFLKGRFIGSSTIVTVYANSNGVDIDVEVDMTNGTGTGVNIAAADCMFSVKGINTVTNKKLVNIGASATGFVPNRISGDTLDVNMTYNGSAIDLFKLEHLNGLSGKCLFGGESQYFVMKGGQAYSNIVPTRGVFIAGDSYNRESFNAPTGDEVLFSGTYRRVEEGRVYSGSAWKPKYCIYDVS